MLWHRLVIINQALGDEDAMIKCTEKLGEDDNGALLGSDKLYYYETLADQAIMKQNYDSNLKHMKMAIDSGDKLLQEAMITQCYFLYSAEMYYVSSDS